MPASEPQFATVSLLLGEEVEGTFRVPITDETTVRRLAKDAMIRLLTRRGDGRPPLTRETISISEVFVNNDSQKAEIFAQDLVTQVVLVKEEVLYMRLRVKDVAPAKTEEAGEVSRAASTNVIPATAGTTTSIGPNKHCISAPVEGGGRAAAVVASTLVDNGAGTKASSSVDVENRKISQRQQPSEKTKAHDEEKRVAPGDAEKTLSRRKSAPDAKHGTEEDEERNIGTMGIGARRRATERHRDQDQEEHDDSVASYIAGPNKLMPNPRARQSAAKTKESAPPVKETAPPVKETAPPVKEPLPESDVQPKCRLGWGPEAEKYFADNYVTSPDRLARQLRKAKQDEKKLQEETKKKMQKAREEEEENFSTGAGSGKPKATGRGLGLDLDGEKNSADSYIAGPNKLMPNPRARQSAAKTKETAPPVKEPLPESDVQPKCRLGWGPEAEKYFADNYVTSPDRLARQLRKAKQDEKKLQEETKKKMQKSKKEEEEDEEKEQMDKNVASERTISSMVYSFEDKQHVQNEEQHRGSTSQRPSTIGVCGTVANEEGEEPRTVPALQGIASTPQTTQNNAWRRGSGSTATRKRRLSGIGEGMCAACPIVVERQLSYEASDDVAGAHTPEQQSTRRLLQNGSNPSTAEAAEKEEQKQQQPPPGWGREALRYFDVETYFDDPSKAKLSPEILSRPVRARRDVVLPFYFASLDK